MMRRGPLVVRRRARPPHMVLRRPPQILLRWAPSQVMGRAPRVGRQVMRRRPRLVRQVVRQPAPRERRGVLGRDEVGEADLVGLVLALELLRRPPYEPHLIDFGHSDAWQVRWCDKTQ